ncbi:hypothetical protein GJ744_002539 [Endocarpon pusillum]|uniref:Uncharacterized protein n=1 Tax=Endocarpon pusillum TaxID=364733 RepID=A0A8H7DZ10_9EURO|nr:hypothetical protein GJ744_002539 [Endocarpon pusillum]
MPSNPPQAPPARGYDIAQRVQALTLMIEGISRPEIEKRTGVKKPAQRYIWQKAQERGFQPDIDPRIHLQYVEDGARSA